MVLKTTHSSRCDLNAYLCVSNFRVVVGTHVYNV